MKSLFKPIAVFLLFILSLHAGNEKKLEKVSIQLQWLDQFQFAGYYIAKEKGFYKDIGLDVEIKKYEFGIIPADEVINKKATYGTGRSTLIIDKCNGKDIELLAAIFQSSPLMLLATEDSGIKSIKDFKNKRAMFTPDAAETASLHAMTNKFGIQKKDMILQQHSFDVSDLINKNTDLMVSYISNEPYTLIQKGGKPLIFHPKDHGFDFYSDILFTNSDELNNHASRVQKFTKASLKGWKYAFDHIDEAVDIILKKYNTQNKTKEALIFEAKELKKLAYYETDELGHIDSHKIQRIYDIYNVMGLIKNDIDLKELIKHEFAHSLFLTTKEKEYLKNKKELTVCVRDNWLPYEGIKNGKFIGISADYLKMITHQLGVSLKVKTSKNDLEVMKLFKNKECDLKPVAIYRSKKKIPYKATDFYIKDNMALITNIEQPFIGDLSKYMDKKFVILQQHYGLTTRTKKLFPNIKLIQVKSMEEALKKVAKKEAIGFIDKSLSSIYYIQKYHPSQFKIMNQFEDLNMGLGVIEEDKVLFNIMQKALNSIDEAQRIKTRNKWTTATIEKQKINYEHLWRAIIIFLSVLSIMIFFFIKQNRLKEHIESLNENLKSVNASLKIAQEIAQLGSWELDLVENKLYWSDEVYNILGTTKEETQPSYEKFISFIHPDDRELFNNKYTASISQKQICNTTHRIVLKNGTVKYVHEKCQHLYNKGKPIKSIGSILDITKEIESQILLEQRVKEEVEKNRQNELQLLEQAKMASMGEMIGNIAHQWRQPLASISSAIMNIRLKIQSNRFNLENKDDRDKLFKIIEKKSENIDGYVEYLSDTINTFREFLKEGKELKEAVLQETIDKALNIVNAALKNNHISLRKNIDYKNLIEISTISSELSQAIINIISNAKDILVEKEIKDAWIEISLMEKNNKAIITIEDNGGGIPEDIMPKIFDPYFTTKHQSQGTGLGLNMSYKIVTKSLKGRLYAKNTQNGAKFFIELPLNENNK